MSLKFFTNEWAAPSGLTMELYSFAAESSVIYWTIIEGNVTIRNRITMSGIIALETQLDSLE